MNQVSATEKDSYAVSPPPYFALECCWSNIRNVSCTNLGSWVHVSFFWTGEQLSKFGFLFLPRGFKELNSGHWACIASTFTQWGILRFFSKMNGMGVSIQSMRFIASVVNLLIETFELSSKKQKNNKKPNQWDGVGMGESLNISKRNIRGKLGLKSFNWAQMPSDTELTVFSYAPSSASFFGTL